MTEKITLIWDNICEAFGKYVVSAVSEIGITDIIDILILSVLLFGIYKFIRERRAGRLALGILLVTAALLLSIVFNMRALKFILENFYQVGIVAIIVIFQSDLRAALERVGSTRIKNLRNVAANENKAIVDMADILAEAVDSLARTQTGALIAIERETRLGEYLSQGVIVNADMSAPLLRNLFFNKAPLHDGAVIIRNKRIYAAGCFLPLSTADVNKDLGTRHRAALGLSEVSDALVIVVSEETGTISMMVDGKMERNFTYGSLKQEILKYLLPSEQTVKPLDIIKGGMNIKKAKKGSEKK